MTRNNRKPRRSKPTGLKKKNTIRKEAGGRVHLKLHHEGSHGGEVISMVRAIFREDWQNRIALAAVKTARSILGKTPRLTDTIGLAQSTATSASSLSQSLLNQAPPGAVACKQGCNYCCHQSVGLTPPEAILIVHYLHTHLNATQLSSLTQDVILAHKKTQHITQDERNSPEFPCPLLVAGECSVYAVRPLTCRGMNALDAQECKRSLERTKTGDDSREVGDQRNLFLEPIRGIHAISAGLQIALNEIYHLDMRPIELTAALHLLLNQDNSIADEWLAGQPVFDSAHRKQRPHSRQLLELSGRLPS